ncbi:MAG: hypothetical protein MUF34_09685 [Polyangiaceae bacterium]|jgi:hypothetical protein|nr:hypothetical protein [Polyangiaceae bacterium]
MLLRHCALAAVFALGAPTCRPRSDSGAQPAVASSPLPGASSAALPGVSLWPPPALGPPLSPVDTPPFRALGHAGGRYEVRLWSSDPAGYRSSDAPVAGLVVCAEHREGAEPAAADLITCMRREAATGEGAWSYGVMGRGGPWLRVGPLDDCARCHRSAPREGLFGPPSEAGGAR